LSLAFILKKVCPFVPSLFFGLSLLFALLLSYAPITAAALPAVTAARYTVTDLGPLPAVSDEVALSLNDAGQVGFWQSSGGVVHAAMWEKGKARDLGVPQGFISSIARAINRSGQVIGWATTSRNLVDSLAVTHACLFATGGKVTDLGTLGGRNSQAFGINSSGQIVGGSLRADGNRHAFLYTAGKMTDLGTLPGGKFSQAYAISETGTVVGISEIDHAAVHACLWQQGKVTDLGALPGGHVSLGTAINRSGAAAGAAEAGNEYHATLYALGKVRDLGTLGSDPAAVAGLNDKGQAVGASNLSTIVRHAFLFDGGRMTDLNTLIPADSSWTILTATAINGHGQIVGTARRSHDLTHAVLLTQHHP